MLHHEIFDGIESIADAFIFGVLRKRSDKGPSIGECPTGQQREEARGLVCLQISFVVGVRPKSALALKLAFL